MNDRRAALWLLVAACLMSVSAMFLSVLDGEYVWSFAYLLMLVVAVSLAFRCASEPEDVEEEEKAEEDVEEPKERIGA